MFDKKNMNIASRLPLWGLVVIMVVAPGMRAAGQTGEFGTLILSPEPNDLIPQTTAMISLSFIDPGRVLNVNSVRLVVDQVDRTSDANINGDVLVWLPDAPLTQGPHGIRVTMNANDGSPLPTVSWSFIVTKPPEGVVPTIPAAPEERKGLPSWAMLKGNVTVEGSMNNVGGDGADFQREAPFTGKAWLNVNGQLGKSWRYAAYTHVNSYESSTRQPINRLRFNLRNNWMTLLLGDATPHMQELILWGRRVRGWSLDLRGGIVNVAVVSGQSRRAIQPALYSSDLTAVFRRGTFGQDLFAVRPYFGNGKRFQLGITVMKVRDDVNSVDDLRTQPDISGVTESANPLPKDNLVAGLDLSIRALQGKFTLSYSNAASLYTNDISGGPITKTELDSVLLEHGIDDIGLNPEDFENIFIINESMIPLDPTGFTSLAHQVRSSLQLGSHLIGARWRSVGGSYYTLGYPSLMRDRSGFRIQDSFSLLEERLRVTVGWESYNDNLDDMKPTTTGTSALTLDLYWQQEPTSPGFSLGYRNYARQNDEQNPANGGLDESTGTISAGAFVPVSLVGGIRSRLNLNILSVGRDDVRNPLTGTKNNYYLLGLSNSFLDRPTDFAISYGMNTSDLTGYPDATTTFHRVLLQGRHTFSQNWNGIGDIVMTRAVSPEDAGAFGLDYSRWEMTGGAEYYWKATSYASLRAGFISFTDNRRTGYDSTQLVVRLRVTQAF